ncbi:hypothetical protein COXBURSA331_A1724 [Coxiella burnetii RSA 331]|nr:hypothetical protein COXBURSA331_A1724 [Coxiella burnetii RSA 331]
MSRNVYDLGVFSKILVSLCCCGANEEARQPLNNDNRKPCRDFGTNNGDDDSAFLALWGNVKKRTWSSESESDSVIDGYNGYRPFEAK